MAQGKFVETSSISSCMTELHAPADSGGTALMERDYIGGLAVSPAEAEESAVTTEIDYAVKVAEYDEDDNEGEGALQQQRELQVSTPARSEDTDLHLGLGPPRSSPAARPLTTTAYGNLQSLHPLPSVRNPTLSIPVPTMQHSSKSGGTKRSYAEAMSDPPMRIRVPKSGGSTHYKFGGCGHAFEGPNARSFQVPHKPTTSHELSLGEVGQVVGWPPVRSFRKHTLVSKAKPSGEEEHSLYVKVNMDGIPIGRKLDLNAFNGYQELRYAIEEMFQPSMNGPEPPSTHFRFRSKSEYALTYEDKDGDWMLVGDVPWDMFVNTVRRLRVMKDGGES